LILTERKASSRRVFSGRLLRVRVDKVVLLPDGRETVREVVEHPGAVAIVALTGDDCVLLVRQYRYAAGRNLLELPAGTLELGEDPVSCAHRELGEETGRRAASLEPLSTIFTSPGFCDERIHLFLARVDAEAAAGLRPDPDERLAVETVKLDDALAMVLAGQIEDAKSAVGLTLAAAKVGALRQASSDRAI
jgi:ADP-ribose pyrophosphatase